MRLAPAIALAAALLSAACGTAVYTHQFEVTVNDPSGRLGAGPVDVSIFDKYAGYSETWAQQTMGVATASKPYAGTVNDQSTRWAWDSSLPPRVDVGLAVPAVEKNGYFVVDMTLASGQPGAGTARFARWDAFSPETDSSVPPLPVRYEGEPARTRSNGNRGWLIRLTVDVPPKP
jgi:hypothetical protein